MPDESSFGAIGYTVDAFEQAFRHNLYSARGATPQSASALDIYQTLAHTVRDYLMQRRRKTTEAHFAANPKFVYYLSAEYLLGRQLTQNMLYTGVWEIAEQAAARNGLRLKDFIHLDHEPGLGNGGLGRLAACFIDSLATLDMPARRLRHPLRIRHLRAGLSSTAGSRRARHLAALRQPLGVQRSPTTWRRWASAATPSPTATMTGPASDTLGPRRGR
jgi:hypothetical protein